MGLNWNVKGSKTVGDLVGALSGAKPAATTGVPPPPPIKLPPPPPVNAPLAPVKPSSGGGDVNALFSQINVGEDITKSTTNPITSSAQEGR
jgi:hypothetical protein